LARIAGEVFLGLVTELERQGVGKKVAADMFGLALRSFQLKVQRVRESVSERGLTLWSAVRLYIEKRGSATRREVLERFARDDAASVRGILNDLVESGVVYRTGRGEASLYRATPPEDVGRLAEVDRAESDAALVWLTVTRDGPLTRAAVVHSTGLDREAVDRALEELEASDKVQQTGSGEERCYSAGQCLIPVGDEAGWEAAVIDHHQAVLNAIAAKIESGNRTSSAVDATGGSTFAFELWPGHPEEEAVRGLLARTRSQAAELWDRVSSFNAQGHPDRPGSYRVSFYLGQYLCSEQDAES
jgi:CRP-like cAMP-binding protein